MADYWEFSLDSLVQRASQKGLFDRARDLRLVCRSIQQFREQLTPILIKVSKRRIIDERNRPPKRKPIHEYLYWELSLEELIEVVEKRDLDVDVFELRQRYQSTLHFRQQLTSVLEEADKGKRSYLLEVPPEMRILIYEYLVDTGELRTCRPQVLATNKQVYKEASSILYGKNKFTINVGGSQVSIQGRFGNLSMGNISDILRSERPWPSFLRKVEKLRVHLTGTVYYSRPPPSGQCELRGHHVKLLPAINRVLYALCSFLSQRNSIKSLDIDFAKSDDTHKPTQDCECLQRTLYGVAMLDHLTTLVIEGEACPELLAKVKKYRPDRTLLATFKAAISAAECHHASQRANILRLPDRELELIKEVQDMREHVFIGSEWEAAFRVAALPLQERYDVSVDCHGNNKSERADYLAKAKRWTVTAFLGMELLGKQKGKCMAQRWLSPSLEIEVASFATTEKSAVVGG